MSCSTLSGHVGHERAARATEPVVDVDAGGQGEQPLGDPDPQAARRPSPVALEGEDVLEGSGVTGAPGSKRPWTPYSRRRGPCCIRCASWAGTRTPSTPLVTPTQ